MSNLLDTVKELDLPRAQLACMDEAVRFKKSRAQEDRDYYDEISGFIFFINTCLSGTPIKPKRVSKVSFQNFKPSIERFVKEKYLYPSALEIFSNPEHIPNQYDH